MGFIFAWGNFRKDEKSVKNVKITPTQKYPRLTVINTKVIFFVLSKFFYVTSLITVRLCSLLNQNACHVNIFFIFSALFSNVFLTCVTNFKYAITMDIT